MEAAKAALLRCGNAIVAIAAASVFMIGSSSAAQRGAPTSPKPPPGIRPEALATQLLGEEALGDMYPVKGGRDDWVLVVRLSRNTQDRYEVNGHKLIALVHWEPAPNLGDKPVLRVIATKRGRLTQGSAGDAIPYGEEKASAPTEGAAVDTVQATVPCVNPLEGTDFGNNEGRQYPEIVGEFRWLKLSAGRRVLAATVAGRDLFVGGLDAYEAELLLEPRAGKLVPVACSSSSRYQTYRDAQNRDGTWQHSESEDAWKLRPVGSGPWPRLHLRPTTVDTAGAYLVWDEQLGHYRKEQVPKKKTRARE
jgi:hypothetical protein